MRDIKPGFSLLIALLALGITLVTQAAIFRHTVAAPGVADCYTNITYGTPPGCKSTNLVINMSVFPGLNALDQPVLQASEPIELANACAEGGDLFCCAQVMVSKTPVCTQQPKITMPDSTKQYVKIVTIYGMRR
jgi:hypothetical protein